MKMFLTFVTASTLACLLGASLESGGGNDAAAVTTVAPPKTRSGSASIVTDRAEFPEPLPAETPRIVPASFPTPGDIVDKPDTSSIATPTSVSPRDALAFCKALDLVERPDLADDMVRIAGAAYGTPPGLLNGIWETESDHGIDGQTGTCSVMAQYDIRDCWFPGKETKRPEGCASPYVFAGESPTSTRWKRPTRSVGKGAVQKRSIVRIASALGISAWSIKGSCGRSRLDGRPDHRPTFGGCFGNMQITPSEWENDVKAMGFGLSELSPFSLCDSMLVSSYRLRKHHDQRLARYTKKVGASGLTPTHDQLSWLWAGRRYYGSPEKATTDTYERHFKWGRANREKLGIFDYLDERKRGSRTFPCGWRCWDDMARKGDFSPLVNHITWKGRRHRSSDRYASN